MEIPSSKRGVLRSASAVGRGPVRSTPTLSHRGATDQSQHTSLGSEQRRHSQCVGVCQTSAGEDVFMAVATAHARDVRLLRALAEVLAGVTAVMATAATIATRHRGQSTTTPWEVDFLSSPLRAGVLRRKGAGHVAVTAQQLPPQPPAPPPEPAAKISGRDREDEPGIEGAGVRLCWQDTDVARE